MVQVLHISNGDTLNEKLEAKDNRLDKLLAEKSPNDEIIDEAVSGRAVAVSDAKRRSRSLPRRWARQAPTGGC